MPLRMKNTECYLMKTKHTISVSFGQNFLGMFRYHVCSVMHLGNPILNNDFLILYNFDIVLSVSGLISNHTAVCLEKL